MPKKTKKTSSTYKDRTSVKSIFIDVLTSMLLLVGAWIIELLKASFPEPGAPALMLIILNTSELTLLVYFFIELLLSIQKAYKEFDKLILLIKGSYTAKSIENITEWMAQSGSIGYRAPWHHRLRISFLVTVIITSVVLLIVWLIGSSISWPQVAVYSAVIVFFIFSTMNNASDNTEGCMCVFLAIAPVSLIFSLIMIFFTKMNIAETVRKLLLLALQHTYLNQSGLLFQAISIVVSFFVILSIITIALKKLLPLDGRDI